jgi:hypothetical protein
MKTKGFFLHISRKFARFKSSKNTPHAYDGIGRGGDECSGFENPIGQIFLSGNRIFYFVKEGRDGRMDRRGN